MKPVVLIGRGGHALSCLDVLRATKQYDVLGYVDKTQTGDWEGLPCLGNDSELSRVLKTCSSVVIAIGQVESSEVRRNVVERLQKLGAQFPVIVAPTAYVASGVKLGEGTIVMHGAHVGPGVVAGSFNIFNTKSLIEHGCQLGSFIHVATAAVINGDVSVSDNVFIGSNSVLCQGIRVPPSAFVQAGAFIGRKHDW